MDYTIGATYFSNPEPGTPIHEFLIGELKIDRLATRDDDEDTVVYKGKVLPGFWEGKHAPKDKHIYRAFSDYLRNVLKQEEGFLYPEIPLIHPEHREVLNTLDKISLRKRLEDQDNWQLPCLESAVGEGLVAAEDVKRLLGAPLS